MTGRDAEAPAARAPAAFRGGVVGVVLAAGKATRMGGSKVVRPVGGRPMVERVVDAALASRLDGTIVVIGNEGDEVERILTGRPVRLVENLAFADGLSTSVHAALRSLGPDCGAALFLLADQPFVSAGLIDRLLEEYVATGKPIVRPEVDGRPGNPVLFSARLFPELLRETGDRGGREVVERHLAEVHVVPVDDPALCLDVDTLEDYERLREG
jgi:molybdenum cofactor cytidylyltransferase